MRVMVLVKATVESESGLLPSTELLEAMTKFHEELANAGVMLAGEGLKPSSSGKRVAFNGADRSVYDGPFEETTRASGFERSEIQLRRSTGRSDAQLDARSERDRNLCHAALNCRLVHAHCCSLFEKHFKAISVVRLNEFRKYDSLLLSNPGDFVQ